MEEQMVTISLKEYNELKKDAIMLEALRQGGVDNWEWYSEALVLAQQWENEDAKKEEVMKGK